MLVKKTFLFTVTIKAIFVKNADFISLYPMSPTCEYNFSISFSFFFFHLPSLFVFIWQLFLNQNICFIFSSNSVSAKLTTGLTFFFKLDLHKGQRGYRHSLKIFGSLTFMGSSFPKKKEIINQVDKSKFRDVERL